MDEVKHTLNSRTICEKTNTKNFRGSILTLEISSLTILYRREKTKIYLKTLKASYGRLELAKKDVDNIRGFSKSSISQFMFEMRNPKHQQETVLNSNHRFAEGFRNKRKVFWYDKYS